MVDTRLHSVTNNGAGDHLCIDMNPAGPGLKGQIIAVWHDDGKRSIKADSFAQWFGTFTQSITKNLLNHPAVYQSAVAPKQQRLEALFADCQKQVISQIIGPFGLSLAMFEDRNGGNVTTVAQLSREDDGYITRKGQSQPYPISQGIRPRRI